MAELIKVIFWFLRIPESCLVKLSIRCEVRGRLFKSNFTICVHRNVML